MEPLFGLRRRGVRSALGATPPVVGETLYGQGVESEFLRRGAPVRRTDRIRVRPPGISLRVGPCFDAAGDYMGTGNTLPCSAANRIHRGQPHQRILRKRFFTRGAEPPLEPRTGAVATAEVRSVADLCCPMPEESLDSHAARRTRTQGRYKERQRMRLQGTLQQFA